MQPARMSDGQDLVAGVVAVGQTILQRKVLARVYGGSHDGQIGLLMPVDHDTLGAGTVMERNQKRSLLVDHVCVRDDQAVGRDEQAGSQMIDSLDDGHVVAALLDDRLPIGRHGMIPPRRRYTTP